MDIVLLHRLVTPRKHDAPHALDLEPTGTKGACLLEIRISVLFSLPGICVLFPFPAPPVRSYCSLFVFSSRFCFDVLLRGNVYEVVFLPFTPSPFRVLPLHFLKPLTPFRTEETKENISRVLEHVCPVLIVVVSSVLRSAFIESSEKDGTDNVSNCQRRCQRMFWRSFFL